MGYISVGNEKLKYVGIDISFCDKKFIQVLVIMRWMNDTFRYQMGFGYNVINTTITTIITNSVLFSKQNINSLKFW